MTPPAGYPQAPPERPENQGDIQYSYVFTFVNKPEEEQVIIEAEGLIEELYHVVVGVYWRTGPRLTITQEVMNCLGLCWEDLVDEW